MSFSLDYVCMMIDDFTLLQSEHQVVMRRDTALPPAGTDKKIVRTEWNFLRFIDALLLSPSAEAL
jgi:hypothetical protein